jgi:hypothetical protein
VRASDQIIYASGVEAARPQLARYRLATSFLDDQDERIDVSRMLDMAASLLDTDHGLEQYPPPLPDTADKLTPAGPSDRTCC